MFHSCMSQDINRNIEQEATEPSERQVKRVGGSKVRQAVNRAKGGLPEPTELS